MKQSILFLLVFVFSTQGCASNGMDSFNVLIKEKNKKSGYSFVVEDYGYYFWAVLYKKDSFSPVCSCFIGTNRNPLSVSEMPAPFNGNPPISESFASDQAVLGSFSNKDLNVKWNKSGELVIVYLKEQPLCLLDGKNKKSFSKAVKKNGSYGSIWDTNLFHQAFNN